MKNLSLILRILAIVAAVVATTLFFISKGKLAEKEAQLTTTKQQLDTTQTQLSDTSNQLTRTETQLKREQADHAQTESTLKNVRSDLSAAELEVSKTTRLLKNANNELAEVRENAEEIKAELVATKEELANASREAEINQLTQRVAELEKSNAELEDELETKTAIADAMSSKDDSSGGQATSSIDTSVTSINTGGERISRIKLETTVSSISTADGLIVLNTNPDLGLTAGQTITLVQDLKSVGKVQIQTIKNGHAIANILPGSTGTKKLNSGSTVQLLL